MVAGAARRRKIKARPLAFLLLRRPDAGQKNGDPCGAAKFREETSKKADSATRGRIAARHKLGDWSFVCKRYFALQHKKYWTPALTRW
jgi:hypothetical protein